jgi:hypothetical protein
MVTGQNHQIVEEIQIFLNDLKTLSYEKFVDRMLILKNSVDKNISNANSILVFNVATFLLSNSKHLSAKLERNSLSGHSLAHIKLSEELLELAQRAHRHDDDINHRMFRIIEVVFAVSIEDHEDAKRKIDALETDRDDPVVLWALTHCAKELGTINDIDEAAASKGLEASLFTIPKFELKSLFEEEKKVARHKKPYKSKKWNYVARQQDGLQGVIQDQISAWPDGPRLIFSRTDKFVTMGSCFATNLAVNLRNRSIDCLSYNFAEEVNNTYTNLEFVRTVAQDGEASRHGQSVHEEFHAHLQNADAVIFTCGTSIAFRDSQGDFIVPKNLSAVIRYGRGDPFDIVNVSVDENYRNLLGIIAILKKIRPDIRIVMTVSPVPLSRAFGTESALIGDCISKSSLRMGVDRVVRDEIENVYYWPSFEIAKWLLPHYGGHVSPSLFFGADDGESRHVSKNMIDMIVSCFIDYAFYD